MQEPTTIDDYIGAFPIKTQAILNKVRQTIRQAAPEEATEEISYKIPTFKVNGHYLIYFAGWKDHVAIYPIPTNPDPELKERMMPFIKGKGTLSFPLDQPLPYDLIQKVVLAQIAEHPASKKD